MAKCIVLASQKGGVGKTTIALNLAVVLAERGRSTILLDLDPQGAVGLALGRDETEWIGVAEYLMNKATIDDILRQTKIPSLWIVPRGGLDARDVCEYEKVMQSQGMLKQLLDGLSRKAEYIIIDTPSGLGMVTQATLSAANYVIVPVQAEHLALRSTSQILRVIEHIREQENPTLEMLGILPTMVELGKEPSLNVMGALWSGFGGVFDTIIPRTELFATASQVGLPIGFLKGRPTSEARRFDQLVSELDGRIQAVDGGGNDQAQRELV